MTASRHHLLLCLVCHQKQTPTRFCTCRSLGFALQQVHIPRREKNGEHPFQQTPDRSSPHSIVAERSAPVAAHGSEVVQFPIAVNSYVTLAPVPANALSHTKARLFPRADAQ